jgi:hypothetical protein
MDITLREYLAAADAIHQKIEMCGVILKPRELEQYVNQLQTGIRTIQSIAKRMADISNIANEIILYKKEGAAVKTINTYPSENDHATISTLYADEFKEPHPGIKVPVKVVKTLAQIPKQHLYYVENIKSYAVNIGGVCLRGGLANYSHYQEPYTARCEYGTQCKNIALCKYYHEPEDYLRLHLEVPDRPRNFTIGSYIYSKKKTPSAYFTRHIGGKSTLEEDFLTLKQVQFREEIATREGQLIHDLLIYMMLHSKGLLERYPVIPKIEL